ncbi:MAG: Peptidase [Thermoleophilia bacterium]|nr:Peptidase [Thermoleophilia bacterium]
MGNPVSTTTAAPPPCATPTSASPDPVQSPTAPPSPPRPPAAPASAGVAQLARQLSTAKTFDDKNRAFHAVFDHATGGDRLAAFSTFVGSLDAGDKQRLTKFLAGASAAPAPGAAAPARPTGAAAGRQVKPVEGYTVTQGFGGAGKHPGIDLSVAQGTPIVAPARGKVVESAFEAGGYGNYVTVDHGDGTFTRFGHMVAPSGLHVGDVVEAGGALGNVGSTGNSTGPHLHFEVLRGGVAPANRVDPAPFLAGTAKL